MVSPGRKKPTRRPVSAKTMAAMRGTPPAWMRLCMYVGSYKFLMNSRGCMGARETRTVAKRDFCGKAQNLKFRTEDAEGAEGKTRLLLTSDVRYQRENRFRGPPA